MFDFIIDLFAEIADFFITFWADNVIDKFTKRNKQIQVWGGEHFGCWES